MTKSADTSTSVPSPWDLRADLVSRITADLLGPLDGENEVIIGYQFPDGKWSSPGRVRDRYLVGMLAPEGTVASDPERDDSIGPEPDDGANAGDDRDGCTTKLVLAQSSMGLSVVADATAKRLIARCSWGQYSREFHTQNDGSRAAVWVRKPQQVDIVIPLKNGEFGPLSVNGEGIELRGRVTSSDDGPWLVTVFLSNRQEPGRRNKDSRWMFQVRLDLLADGNAAVFLGRNMYTSNTRRNSNRETESTQLDLQYRDVVEFAVGHGVGTKVEKADGDPRRAVRCCTAVVPQYEVWRTDAPKPETSPQLTGLVTDMKTLSELEPEQLRAALLPLAEGYRVWLDEELARIGDAAARLEGHERVAHDTIAQARRIADAVMEGIELVCSDPDALNAFQFANQAMWQQRVHTVAIGARHLDSSLSLQQAVRNADISENRSWRPFQLAFILLCIPSLTDPAHPERSHQGALADLLFFPTGGGKTEAYLGLVAYTLATRRLQGVIGGKQDSVDGRDGVDKQDSVDGRDGVAVLMRYTLRLLTAQQFQRAATLICAAERLRQHRAKTDTRYSGTPFRLGMWVGGSVSPNMSRDAQRFAEEARMGGYSRGQATPVQLTDCPWCGNEIDIGNDCRYDSVLARFLIFCGNAKECVFTEVHTAGEGIPVVTVDEEIYRLLPSFIIGTIDKFAQLPWNGATSTLFGRVESYCERHGYRNPDLDRSHQTHWMERDAHKSQASHPPARTLPSLRLRPPDLIIQDEMHLVTGPLGTMAGLYETAIDRLATWNYNGREVRPKVVASTATTRRARQQAWSVFWRDLRIFPPPVLDVRRSFFAEQVRPSPQTPGRLYLGICAHGERLKQVELRVFSSVMAAAKAIWNELGDNAAAADPWMTTVGYFNSVRELAGMRRMAEDELRTKLRRTRFTRGLANRPTVELKELTSRVSADDIKSILHQLFVTHDPANAENNDRPIDLLLATNMISVGVDVSRLASMVVVGQPKATAEYIQATSRVGRDPKGPGLVITLYNWARPRDLSHYETFSHYHATFYRHVESLSVTPFSERALDKGLTGILVSAVRHSDQNWNPNWSARKINRPDQRIAAHVQAIAERAQGVTGNIFTAELVTDMANKRLDAWDREAVLRPELSYAERTAEDVALLDKPEAGDWNMWTCPNSLRDTEVQVNLQIFEEDQTYESNTHPEIIINQPDDTPSSTGRRGPVAADTRPVTVDDEDIDEAIEVAEAEDQVVKRSRR
ncbi:MAG: DISARM system helicase DrmA [Acidimicrobiaceae bacterium]|nr:DISARM system helicase DrmA [Acidimicrobiaceae bacterium]